MCNLRACRSLAQHSGDFVLIFLWFEVDVIECFQTIDAIGFKTANEVYN